MVMALYQKMSLSRSVKKDKSCQIKRKKINEIQKTQNKRKDETNDSMVKIDDERGQLKQNDLDYLCNFTRFDKTEILDWFRCFIFDCPSGSLRKEKVLEMYTMILPEKNAQVFVNHIFRVFDRDNNGCIDFKEFMLATDMTTGGTVEEKLRWAFKMYDKDGSGQSFFEYLHFYSRCSVLGTRCSLIHLK